MRKRSQTYVIRFHNVSKLKNPEEHYLSLYSYICPREMRMNWKLGNQSYEDRYKEVKGRCKMV